MLLSEVSAHRLCMPCLGLAHKQKLLLKERHEKQFRSTGHSRALAEKEAERLLKEKSKTILSSRYLPQDTTTGSGTKAGGVGGRRLWVSSGSEHTVCTCKEQA